MESVLFVYINYISSIVYHNEKERADLLLGAFHYFYSRQIPINNAYVNALGIKFNVAINKLTCQLHTKTRVIDPMALEMKLFLALNAPITTKVVCFPSQLKFLRSLYGKQCGPRPDCSYKSSLF